jgi:DNA-binding MarR family transcriptional regulator
MPEANPQPEPPAADEMVAAVVPASRGLVAVSARSLAAVEETLTVPQFRMLVVLEAHGATNLSRLAEQLAVNPSTAMRMADRLITAGTVERTTDPADRRAAKLILTEAGHRVVHEATSRRRAEIARIVTAMPPERRGAMVEALQAFADAAGEPQIDPGAYGEVMLPGWS